LQESFLAFIGYRNYRMFKPLNPLLHSQLRLAIISYLVEKKQVEFTLIKDKTGATAGNLSIQLRKLEKAGYLEMKKSYRNNKPVSNYRITSKGTIAFKEYVDKIQYYISNKNNN